mmetsp:Transcript_19800/g.33724  ORF Transcript_19800/g.33724 Transcript_19800/m.33724 type:complete len:283 (-) Transcript_19800:131-979(-)
MVGSPASAIIAASSACICLEPLGSAGLFLRSSVTASRLASTLFSACTSSKPPRCFLESERSWRRQPMKREPVSSMDTPVTSMKTPFASSSPEIRFMPKKPETAEHVPMQSPAIERSSSRRAMRLRSLSSVSSRTSWVVSMFEATPSILSTSASSRASYTSRSVSMSSCARSASSASSSARVIAASSSSSTSLMRASKFEGAIFCCRVRHMSAMSSSFSSTSSSSAFSRRARACRELSERRSGSSLPRAASLLPSAWEPIEERSARVLSTRSLSRPSVLSMTE